MQNAFAMETRELAAVAGVGVTAIYTAHHREGDFRGIRPRKQPSGRLLWPRAEVERVFDLHYVGYLSEGAHHFLGLARVVGVPSVGVVCDLAKMLTDPDNESNSGMCGATVASTAAFVYDLVLVLGGQVESMEPENSGEVRTLLAKRLAMIEGAARLARCSLEREQHQAV